MISQEEIVIRLLCSALLGSLIGIERERLAWAAGLRTHMLVAVGACLVMIVSAIGFNDVLVRPDIVLDPSRVAAQVVSGIGFIGAGCILLRGEIVRGLTTAASLWVVAAVGLAVGGGLYLAAAGATFIVLAILTCLKPLEEWLQHRNKTYDLIFRVRHQSVSLDVLNQALGYRARRVTRFVCWQTENGESDEVRITMTRLPAGDLPEVMRSIKALPQVHEIVSPESPLGS
jgi:putative Mg2+ transporter-C (MgtC) family protein